MKRILLAALLGGIAMFAWNSIAHMALPLGQSGIHEIPNEPAMLAAMHSTLGETSGLYFFPAIGTAPGAMADYDKKLGVNPSGLVIYHPPGAKSLTAAQLSTELAAGILEALLAAILLSRTRIRTYWGRVGFVTLLGVLASMVTNLLLELVRLPERLHSRIHADRDRRFPLHRPGSRRPCQGDRLTPHLWPTHSWPTPSWRTHSCVPRSHSCERSSAS
jgi:hypothetical protein